MKILSNISECFFKAQFQASKRESEDFTFFSSSSVIGEGKQNKTHNLSLCFSWSKQWPFKSNLEPTMKHLHVCLTYIGSFSRKRSCYIHHVAIRSSLVPVKHTDFSMLRKRMINLLQEGQGHKEFLLLPFIHQCNDPIPGKVVYGKEHGVIPQWRQAAAAMAVEKQNRVFSFRPLF